MSDVQYDSVPLDLDHVTVRAAELRTANGEPTGVYYEHMCEGDWRAGWIYFGGDGWRVTNGTPLTVSPSLRCKVCGHHGYIQDGRWLPA